MVKSGFTAAVLGQRGAAFWQTLLNSSVTALDAKTGATPIYRRFTKLGPALGI